MTTTATKHRALSLPRSSKLAATLALAATCAMSAMAAEPPKSPDYVLHTQPPVERAQHGKYLGEPGIDPDVMTEHFLSAHPDLRWRREALYAYNQKQYDIALNQFKRAAEYGDKPSQAMIAEMYWKGIGVPQDPPIAYAWMDLAAERLYPNFVALREGYWNALDSRQQHDAIERGQLLLATYGDDAAKPRMAKLLNRERIQITGSHVGYTGFLEIIPLTGPMAGTGLRLRGDEYYATKYWQPEKYFEWQDESWNAPKIRKGKVIVGKLQKTKAESEKTQ